AMTNSVGQEREAKSAADAHAEAARINIAGRLERLPMTWYQKRVFVIVATAWLADQVDVALLVFLIGAITKEFHLTHIEIGYLASMTFLGQLVGHIIFGSASDLFGRRVTFQATMIVWGVASFLAAGAWGLVPLMVFRFLIGAGVGGEAPVAQAILSEVIPANERGKYIAFMEGFWAVGFVLSGLISYALLPVAGWRWVFVVVGFFAVAVFWVRRSLPESPRWLADHGRFKEADTAMSLIETEVAKRYGRPLPPPKPFLEDAVRETRNPLTILFQRIYLKRNVMLFSMWFFALLGFYGLNSWIAIMLEGQGLSVVKSVGFVTAIAAGGIPGFYVAALLLEKIGRKPTTALFLVMSAVMAFIYGQAPDLVMLFVTGFIMQFFFFGMWSCLYAYTPELYPTRCRATGAGVASAFGRVGAIAGPIVVGYIISTVGHVGVFTLGAVSFGVAALLVIVLGIETRGKILEEISQIAQTGK
ncbi:MAG TPA: MFS transporter, partial [Lacipirellulaceae bacterium]|nr:MFS transporter [Lacipirellulaceae bacterium]